jgi:hypothetical protein
MTWLRETPYSLHYDLLVETLEEIQGNDLGQRNNVKDWAIRRRVPNAAKSDSMSCEIGNGTVSETAKASVINEGLINLRLPKVQSSLLGNMEGNTTWGGLAYSN